MQKRTNLKIVPIESLEDRRARLIKQDYDLQQKEGEIKKARRTIEAEIQSLMPPLAEFEQEVVVVVDGGIQAKLAWVWSTVIDPRKLHSIEHGSYQDHFWRIVSIPIGLAKDMLPGDVLHEVSKIERKALPQLSIRAVKEK